MGRIKLFIMDVDGTLTNGKIYMGNDGEEVKAFDIKDGIGILLMLPKAGIIPVIITARDSKILENRCKELNINDLYQGSKDKLKTLNEVLAKYKAELSCVAYAGDDLLDLPCMEAVKKAGGKVVCPANAVPEVRIIADYVSGLNAGEGAIRDCIHYLCQVNRKETVSKKIQLIIEQMLEENYVGKASGEYSLRDGTKYTIQEYETKQEKDCNIETHRKHVDIQYMISGVELFKIYSSNCLTSSGSYNREKDIELWQNGIESINSILVPGSFVIVYQNQPHKGAIQFRNSEKVRKVVCKINV